MSEQGPFFQAIVENGGDIIAVVDKAGRVRYVSPSVERWSGFTAAEILKKVLFDLVHPDDRQRAKQAHDRALQHPSSIRREILRLRHKDGSWHAAEASLHNLLHNREVAGIVICVRDITEQLRRDDQLRAEKDKYQLLSENSPYGMALIDADGRWTYLNAQFTALFGYTLEDIKDGRGWFQKAFPDETRRSQVMVMWGKDVKSFKPGEKRPRVFTIVCKSGQVKIANIIVERLATGQHLLTIEDITERRRAEERLRVLENAVENMQLGLTISDPDGTILYSNAAEAAMHGYEPGELNGQSVRVFAPDWLWHKLSMNQEKRMRRYGRESVNVRKDGTEFPVQVLSDVVKDERGAPVAIVTTSEDISHRKHIDNLLKKREQYFKALIENAQDIIVVINRKGVIKFASPAVTRVLGHSAEELLGTPIFDLVHPDERALVLDEFTRGIEQANVVRSLEMRVRADGGGYRTIETISKNLLDDPVVDGLIINCRDITERTQAEEQIKYLSFHDKLTGLYNRAYFEEGLSRLDAERMFPISIILGDTNGLKLTNDVFGHDEGDKLLCKIAQILKACCRKEDIIARWGGDEFAILLPKTTPPVAIDLCDRIRKTCHEAGRSPVEVSIALGVATKDNARQDVNDILKLAENRMYKYKLAESRSAQSSIIATLEKDLMASGFETEEHLFAVKNLAFRFGLSLRLTDAALDELLLLASFHDIGKLSIAPAILVKSEPLSNDEWETIRKHSEIGYRIAKASPEIGHIADAILSHHERWDGTGYPEGKREQAIPQISRVIAVVDSFDMMQRDRPYRKGLSKVEALAELERCAGKQFDPELVRQFMKSVG